MNGTVVTSQWILKMLFLMASCVIIASLLGFHPRDSSWFSEEKSDALLGIFFFGGHRGKKIRRIPEKWPPPFSNFLLHTSPTVKANVQLNKMLQEAWKIICGTFKCCRRQLSSQLFFLNINYLVSCSFTTVVQIKLWLEIRFCRHAVCTGPRKSGHGYKETKLQI